MTELDRDLVQSWIPKRRDASHKGDYGRVRILAGSVEYTGAPYFAAQAAVKTGSGLVHLHVPPEIWPVLAVKCNEVMVETLEGKDDQTLLRRLHEADAVLIGPGLGQDFKSNARTRHLVEELETPLILDADGINAVAGHIHILKARRDRLTVLTPHEGEASRLLGGRDIGPDRAAVAEGFARQTGCVVVLKGHRTVTAFPDGGLFVNTTGNPGMAKGGSGDILAGMILSLLGQGMPAARAVPAAVWLHGYAGDLAARELGEYGMTPTDLLGKIPLALKFD